jgi:hypothetical protein
MSYGCVLTGNGISLIPYAVDALSLMAMSAELFGVPPQSVFDPAHMPVVSGRPVFLERGHD